jgi:predicted nuclease of restriction endonuclease-like (RecB) superfamily
LAKRRKSSANVKATRAVVRSRRPGQAAPVGYAQLLKEIKARIQQSQTRAIFAANAELIHLYWDIGRMIDDRQRQEGWGAAVIPRLARELHNELPEERGFSERNIKRMLVFYRGYPDPIAIVPQPVAQLPGPSSAAAREPGRAAVLPQAVAKLPGPSSASTRGSGRTAIVPQPVAQLPGTARVSPPLAHPSAGDHSILWLIPWGHHALLMEQVDDLSTRRWYMEQTLANGWSRAVLLFMVRSAAHFRQGAAVTNFDRVLPSPQSDLVRQALKDPYIFDFLTLEEPFHERELETGLIRHLEKFLLALGQGFAFVGRQYRIEVGDTEFYIDLLFYHLVLRAFIVIDLKKGAFRPEYAGKLNFYCNVINDRLRHPTDQPTIGLILCQGKDRTLAEYALAGIDKPIGVSSYELTRALPPSLQSALPTVEEIEAELGEPTAKSTAKPNSPANLRSRKVASKPITPTKKKLTKKVRRR